MIQEQLPNNYLPLQIIGYVVPWLISLALGLKWLIEFRANQKKEETIHRSESEKTANEQLAAYMKMLQEDYQRIRNLLKESEDNTNRLEKTINNYERKLKQGSFGAQDLQPMIQAFRDCVESHKIEDSNLVKSLERFDKKIQEIIDCLNFD